MKAEEILQKYIKGNINEIDKGFSTIYVQTALKAMEEYSSHQNQQLIDNINRLKENLIELSDCVENGNIHRANEIIKFNNLTNKDK